MQISYHFALTKIQKLQNLKNNNNNKNFFLYQPVLPEIDRYDWYMTSTAGIFFRYETWGVNRTSLLADTVYTSRTGWYDTVLTPLTKS